MLNTVLFFSGGGELGNERAQGLYVLRLKNELQK